MGEPVCGACGNPRSNHPYRHPFDPDAKPPERIDTKSQSSRVLAIKTLALEILELFEESELQVLDERSTDPLKDRAELVKTVANLRSRIESI